jgi:hypothetical protein
LGGAPDPGSDQAAIIVVAAVVLAVAVDADPAKRNGVGISAFESEVQLVKPKGIWRGRVLPMRRTSAGREWEKFRLR